MADLTLAKTAIELATSYSGPRLLDVRGIGAKLLIVVDPREFSRGCLTSWLENFGEGFEVASVTDLRLSLRPDQLARASAFVLSVGTVRATGQAWLEQQVEWLREQGSDRPVVAILEPEDAPKGEEMVARHLLQGHIPTSSTLELAKAALNLILVGGSYSPRSSHAGPPLREAAADRTGMMSPLAPKLTAREMHVLELLMQGTANKIIAYRLGMSESTVKVHVHNIIKKLNVCNRTEAAVVARNMRALSVMERC